MSRSHLVNLIREISGFLVVDCVHVQQSAEGPEIRFLLQQRDEVISVADEAGGNNFTDLSIDIVGL